MVVNTLLVSVPAQIITDKLNLYQVLIPSGLHNPKYYENNHLERKDLSIRMHLKRLNRRAICYSNSRAMLIACLTIYFWG